VDTPTDQPLKKSTLKFSELTLSKNSESGPLSNLYATESSIAAWVKYGRCAEFFCLCPSHIDGDTEQ
jgi:hypothetical protein